MCEVIADKNRYFFSVIARAEHSVCVIARTEHSVCVIAIFSINFVVIAFSGLQYYNVGVILRRYVFF